jgi:hypothetical protein
MSDTYSFLDFSASIVGPGGAFDLGYGSGNAEEGVTVAMLEAKNTMTIGADGSVMHSLHAGKGGTVTVNLLKTSPTNAKLSAMYNAQSLSSATWGNNVLGMRNSASNDVCVARSVAFQKVPDWQNAKDGSMVAWVFDAGMIDQLLGTF